MLAIYYPGRRAVKKAELRRPLGSEAGPRAAGCNCLLDSNGVESHGGGVSDETYKLDELARAAGTSPRTVRYYVQRGLLPAPAFRGKDTAYGREHLVRLRAIRRLQDAFFPLDAIAVELDRRPLDDIERIADGKELPLQVGVEVAAPPAVLPAKRPIPTASPSTSGRLFRRYEVAPGVELSIADDAPPESRRAAEKILAELQRGEGA